MKMILVDWCFGRWAILVIGLFLHYFITNISKEQVGERALAVSESVARIPEIGEAFKTENPQRKFKQSYPNSKGDRRGVYRCWQSR